MGVVTQHGVAVDGPLQHLLDGEGGADGGYHQDVHALPQPAHLGLEFLETLQGGERVHRRVGQPTAEDVADHRMDRIRLGGKEITELDQSLRHPRTLVQQCAGSQKRLQRHLDDDGLAFQVLPETQMRRAHRVIAEELEFGDRRQPNPDGCAAVAWTAVPGPRVGVVAPGHHVENPVHVVDAAGHHGKAIQ